MAEQSAAAFEVEVVYAVANMQTVLAVQVVYGATIEEAIIESRIVERHPEIDVASARAGIFGVSRPLYAKLTPGDRVEIYRPLSADPKLARRKRARRTGQP